MKSFLLTTAILVAAASSMTAQEMDKHVAADYRWELGANAGGSVNTIPQGPAPLYTGNTISISPAFALHLNYNVNENWQVGAELGETHWQTKGSWAQTDANGVALQAQDIKFNVADAAISFMIQLNHTTPTYSSYTHYNKSNFYYGISAGLVFTTNDGKIMYKNYNQSPDPNFQYVSQYDYGYGVGFGAGAQVGYAYYFVPRFGINVDLAARYAYVGTSDTRYGHENASYNLFYFPCTVGIRYRL